MADKPLEEQQNTSMTSEDYQKALGTESYKQLLQADLQAESAKNVALRNTNMALQNAGLQGNSYGGTLANQTSNSYLTALQQNMSDFNTNIINESTSNMQTINDTLSNASDVDNYTKLLNGMGIEAKDGELDFSNYDGYLTNNQKLALQNAYTTQMNDYETKSQVEEDAKNNIYHDEVEANNTGAGYTNTSTLATGQQISATFDEGSGLNYDLTFKIGDQTFKAEMSNKGKWAECTGKNGKLMTESELKSMYSNEKVGIPFAHKNKDGTYTILVKDQNGQIRRLEKHGARESDMLEIAKALGLPENSKVHISNSANQGAKIGTIVGALTFLPINYAIGAGIGALAKAGNGTRKVK